MKGALFFGVIFIGASICNGGQVVLTSDPPGAMIYAGEKQLGTTPLTADLPPDPIELTSRFGVLPAVVQTLTPSQTEVLAYQFRHSYGTLIVSSDRTDASLTIDGSSFGHPPALVFLAPGTHKVFLSAPKAPDKTRNVDVAEGQRASVEIHFTGPSPETVTSNPSASASPSPADATSSPTPPPAKATRKPKPDPKLLAWQEPPSTLSQLSSSPGPDPSVSQRPQVKASPLPPRNPAKLVRAQPSPASTPDPAKAKALLESERKAKESEFAAERQRIDYEIANSTGANREQWKYKLALWRLKKQQTETIATAEPSKTYTVTASASPAPDPSKVRAEYTLLQSEWKARQSVLSAEKQRIDYQIANSTGAVKKQWEQKLAQWRQEKEQAERDQATAKARLLGTSRATSKD
jgi:hypothetical protein